MEVTDKAFARILGQEIRRAREAQGWSRAQLVEFLPSGIGDRTLLSYEQGLRQLSVVRFVEIVAALGAAPSDLLLRAMEKSGDLTGLSLRVNLRSVVRDRQAGYEPVRRWARNHGTAAGLVLLAPATVRELGAAMGYSHADLAAYLAEHATEDLAE